MGVGIFNSTKFKSKLNRLFSETESVRDLGRGVGVGRSLCRSETVYGENAILNLLNVTPFTDMFRILFVNEQYVDFPFARYIT